MEKSLILLFSLLIGLLVFGFRRESPPQINIINVPPETIQNRLATPPRELKPPIVGEDPRHFKSKPPEPDKIQISATSKGLIEAGKVYPGANVCKSEMHPFLMKLAKDQANYQASICVQGHQNFSSRFSAVQQAGLGHAAEICAESWPWQVNDSMLDLGYEMFKCWRQSPGHWSVASKQHRYFGADIAKGKNGIWYACIIVSN
jgi:hypothetical protein